jgi:ubiquinone biosynthesis protein UbiJ
VSVRKRIDQLTSEPAVGDLGYSADQRQVASAMLGLQFLADEIDDVKRQIASLAQRPAPLPAPVAPLPVPQPQPQPQPSDSPADVSDQLEELTEQLRKLTKAVKKAASKKKR